MISKVVMAVGGLSAIAQIAPVGSTPIDAVSKVTLDVALLFAVGVLWRANAAKDQTIADKDKAHATVIAEKDKAMVDMVARVTEAMTLNNRILSEMQVGRKIVAQ